ncbi:MAG TPA: hypothetical protein VMV27_09125 [Candidatus Binataceae bacterium]|nr:hypothetical protein [Candidatus Binataceae bacterium]
MYPDLTLTEIASRHQMIQLTWTDSGQHIDPGQQVVIADSFSVPNLEVAQVGPDRRVLITGYFSIAYLQNVQGLALVSPEEAAADIGPSSDITTAGKVDLRLLYEKGARLVQMPENWDSYGARRINIEHVVQALTILEQVMRPGTPIPAMVPTPRGGIQVEWHTHGVDIELTIESEEIFQLFFEDRTSGEICEEELDARIEKLDKFVAALSRPARTA